ncbi:MAG: protein kinase [Isosphaerales bacterium]
MGNQNETRDGSAKSIFLDALEIPSAGDRLAYLDRRCGTDSALRAELEALLLHHDRLEGYLERPALDPDATSDRAHHPLAEGAGTVIGPYKLLEQIGEGGMGQVYMAEQTQPVRRRVALKIIKPGMDTKQVIARFEAERQALAMMDHPNIARVLDAGATESGRPYFVMELVRGIPITDYCDRNHLTIEDRLGLFVLVCQAVQHAHQKGIIHRDLKPSNVMVTMIDGAAVPKVIDFGVVKAMGQQLTEKTLLTGFAQLIGTPLYMSPEQAEFSGVDVDTRCDIYSLGVLLYELLTGTTPFDQETFRTAAYDEIRRIIREEEPPKPSTRISTQGVTSTTVSANRQTDPRRLGQLVRGELDWIVMKAMEKDRQRRYETASAFAADVMRHLTDQPVEACPPSVWYRLRKYARRNRVALITGGAMALALVLGTAVSTWQAIRATRAERAARLQRIRIEQNLSLTLHALDDVVMKLVEDQLPRDQSREGEDRALLEKALGFYDEFARANADDPSLRRERAKAYRRAGSVWHKLGRVSEAEQSLRQAILLQEELLASDPAADEPRQELGWSMVELGFVLLSGSGRLAEAEVVLKKAADLMEPLPATPLTSPVHRELRAAIHDQLSHVLQSSGRLVEAEEERRRAVELLSGLAQQFPARPKYRYKLAQTYLDLAYQRTIIKPSGSERGQDLSREREYLDQLNGALASLHRGRDLLQGLVDEFPRNTFYRGTLGLADNREGKALQELRRYPDARTAYERARDLFQSLSDEYPAVPAYRSNLSGSLTNLGNVLRSEGRPQDAGRVHDLAIAIKEKLASDFPKNSDYQSELGASLNNRANTLGHTEACRLLRNAIKHQGAALEAQPQNPTYRRFLRNHWGNLTDDLLGIDHHREAATAVAEFVRVSPDKLRDSFFAAAFLARCAASAEGDSNLSPAERAEAAQSYAGRARGVLKDAADWVPEDAESLNNVAWLLVNGPSPRLYEPARALTLAERAVKLKSNQNAYWYNLGMARYRLGDGKGAIEALDRAASLRTDDDPAVWLVMAMAFWKLGDKHQAITRYKRAIEQMKKTGWDNDEPYRLCAEAAALLGLETPPVPKPKGKDGPPGP